MGYEKKGGIGEGKGDMRWRKGGIGGRRGYIGGKGVFKLTPGMFKLNPKGVLKMRSNSPQSIQTHPRLFKLTPDTSYLSF